MNDLFIPYRRIGIEVVTKTAKLKINKHHLNNDL